ncbi:DUF3304 domain-containing protein [Pseudomonas sp. NPDC098747]|uniref:DUF3304 domain-containing protein n=1 Tax=Pseudomonas sp. NPDC098747 TaxID=3364487 RepID=UPI00383B890B
MSLFSMVFRTLPSSVQWTLFGVTLTAVGGSLLWTYFTPQGAALYSHNHTDRPIFSYWVNGSWGGNASANGGGKITCCSSIVGDQLEVAWIKGRTYEQVNQGLKQEPVELLIPNPPRQRQDDTLHVHFLPNDQVRVAWSADHYSPYENDASSHKPARLNQDTP